MIFAAKVIKAFPTSTEHLLCRSHFFTNQERHMLRFGTIRLSLKHCGRTLNGLISTMTTQDSTKRIWFNKNTHSRSRTQISLAVSLRLIPIFQPH